MRHKVLLPVGHTRFRRNRIAVRSPFTMFFLANHVAIPGESTRDRRSREALVPLPAPRAASAARIGRKSRPFVIAPCVTRLDGRVPDDAKL
jgi:hypothetical protein